MQQLYAVAQSLCLKNNDETPNYYWRKAAQPQHRVTVYGGLDKNGLILGIRYSGVRYIIAG